MIRSWPALLLLTLGLSPRAAQAQDCLGDYSLTFSPLPGPDQTYGCGQTVTFCLTINTWNTTNANWLHGIVPQFGPGWDLSTLTPGTPPPEVGTAGGTWGWYPVDDGTAGTAIGPVGPGFFFDLDNDGDPGNNFGDYATAGPWTFCWTISVVSGSDCIGGTDLSASVETYGDSETGSWGSAGCGGDEIPANPPGTHILDCPDPGVGFTIFLCSTDPPVDLFSNLGGAPDPGGQWTDPSGAPISGSVDPATAPSGSYTYTLPASTPTCTNLSSVSNVYIAIPPNAGVDGTLRVCERDAPVDLFLSLGGTPDIGGYWVDPAGNPMSGVIDPATAADGIYLYTASAIVPCNDDQATVTVIVDKMPDPGTSTSTSVCPDADTFDLFPLLGPTALPGGAWTAPDGTPVSNLFDPGESDGGTYTYTVHGLDACADETISATVDVSVYPAPSAIFTFTPEKGCVPLSVFFTLKSATGITAANWVFGDAYVTSEIPRTNHTYETPGIFPPTVTVTDVNGCRATWTARDPLRAYPPPSASFHYSPFPLRTLFETEADFMAWQGGLDDYHWDIGADSLDGPKVHFGFPASVATTYPVCLHVTDSIGCTAEECQEVTVNESFNVSVPNAFTPNGDGENDLFRPVMLGMDPKSMLFEVYDRWGSKVYGSTETSMGWNGSKDNGGEVLPEGVYVWRLSVRNALSAEREDLMGHVTLLK